MTAVATLRDLTITGPAGVILHRVNLGLDAGTVTGLVGASGAGKTTLAHALLGHVPHGLHRPDGHVQVTGHDPFTPQGRIAVRGRAAAYLPQDPASALDPARTIEAQLHTACRIAHPRTGRRERSRIIRQAIRDAAFNPSLLTRRPLQLSGGQAQRALLAWTFAVRPQLLILDEPTSGLDPASALQVSRQLQELLWRPSVLLISHDSDLIERASNRVVEITGGHLSASASLSTGARRRAPARVPVDVHSRTGVGPSATPSPASSSATPAAVRPAVLQMRDVQIRRGGRAVVHEASLALGAGDLVALRGRSGSGKTSLARALSGHAPPASGTLEIHGRTVPWPVATRARHSAFFIAYVGQDALAALHPAETVRCTLQRALLTARSRRTTVGPDMGEIPATPEALVAMMGLPGTCLDRRPGHLSGGQRHRLTLARSLAAAPTALICDETTAALDHHTATVILDVIDRIRHQTGLPVLVITHQDLVAHRADRVLTLKGGILA